MTSHGSSWLSQRRGGAEKVCRAAGLAFWKKLCAFAPLRESIFLLMRLSLRARLVEEASGRGGAASAFTLPRARFRPLP